MKRTALVTGASSGIGDAFARQLAREGWDLVVVARNVSALDELARELEKHHGVTVDVLAADLMVAEDRARVVNRILSEQDVIEMVVNNAGFGTSGPVSDQTTESQVGMVELNIAAVVDLSCAAVQAMKPRGRGSILNVSSIGGFQASPGFAVYAATKAFVTSFTTALHEELRGSGINVTTLCPGFTRTDFQNRAGGFEATTLPDFVWQQPAQVAEAALAGLAKNRAVVIPGVLNKSTVGLVKVLPAVAARKLAKFVAEH